MIVPDYLGIRNFALLMQKFENLLPKIGIIIFAHELKYKLCYGITTVSSDEIFSSIEACEPGARIICTCHVAFVLEPGYAYWGK